MQLQSKESINDSRNSQKHAEKKIEGTWNKNKVNLVLCQGGFPHTVQYPGGIFEEKCSGCGLCVKVCAGNCLELTEKSGKKVAVIKDLTYCLGDGVCIMVCPEDAFL